MADDFETYMRKLFAMHHADVQMINKLTAELAKEQEENRRLREKLRQLRLQLEDTNSVPAVNPLAHMIDPSLLSQPSTNFLNDQPSVKTGFEDSLIVMKAE